MPALGLLIAGVLIIALTPIDILGWICIALAILSLFVGPRYRF